MNALLKDIQGPAKLACPRCQAILMDIDSNTTLKADGKFALGCNCGAHPKFGEMLIVVPTSEWPDLSKIQPVADPDENGYWTCSACGYHGHERTIAFRVLPSDQASNFYCPQCDKPVVILQDGYRSWQKKRG